MSKKLTLKDISDVIAKLDICMMTTRNAQGMLESRPMSNNRDVDYTGDSYFFTKADTRVVSDIAADSHTCLAYEGRTSLFSGTFYICISGDSELIRDRATMEKHWVPDLEAWFKQGLDTPGLTLIRTRARHIRYWHNWEEGEIHLGDARFAA